MSDYISREAALEDDWETGYATDRMMEIPAAEVVTWGQLKKAWAIATADVAPVVHGRWIEDGYNHYKAVCSECGEPCGTYVMNNPRDRFCKWCGAKMDGGADDD